MIDILRSSHYVHSKPNSTYSSLLTLEQESSFDRALEEDEELNMILFDEVALEDLEFVCEYDDDDFIKILFV